MDPIKQTEKNNCPISNITRRRRINENKTIISPSAMSPSDSYIQANDLHQNAGTPEESGMLSKLSTLLDIKFNKNKLDIITEITNNIQSEVNKAISQLKLDFNAHMQLLRADQNTMKENIKDITNKIDYLEKENLKLQAQIKNLENQTLPTSSNTELITDNTKKLVLYGLTSHHRRGEQELHDQVINIFHDTLNINLEGYIEEIHFVEKSRHRRPLVVELISKRMTKYILKHAAFFKNSGFWISEFLSKQALQMKKAQYEQLKSARHSGNMQ